MEEMNYKLRDTRRIVEYVRRHGEQGVEVEDIIKYAGAEKLRVYPALFELEQEKCIVVMEREELGAPKRVRINT